MAARRGRRCRVGQRKAVGRSTSSIGENDDLAVIHAALSYLRPRMRLLRKAPLAIEMVEKYRVQALYVMMATADHSGGAELVFVVCL